MTAPAPGAELSRPGTAWGQALWVLAAGGVLRLVMAAALPLAADETYYWEWARHPAAGYFDHPPAIALLIRAGVLALGALGIGASALAVRLVPVLAGCVGALAIAGIARRLGGDAAGRRGAIAITVMPLAAAGLVLATPDAPVLAAGAAALYAVVRALQSPLRSRASLGWWSAAGVLLGLAFTSKYTSILVPAGVFVAVATHRELRARLREPGPYVACVLATIVFSPVLFWNAHHGWISFAFQLGHGFQRPGGSAIGRELELLGGQAGLVSPVLFVMALIAMWRALRSDGVRWMLAVVSILTLAFFAYSATHRRVEPNWPAAAWVPALALVSAHAWGERGARWFRAGVWVAAVLSGIVYLHAITGVLPIAPRRDPVARLYGWDSLAARAQLAARANGPHTWLAADRYQDASEIAFHAPGNPEVFALNLAGRPNQYDLWPGFEVRAHRGDDLVAVVDDAGETVHPAVDRLAGCFASVTRGELVPLTYRQVAIGTRRLWLLRDWTGAWPAAGARCVQSR